MLDNMTMSNPVMSSPPRTGASLRKTNKPLMEKRRRARINDSLTQLKCLVIESHQNQSSQFNKLEKADILELTVKHLRNLQEQQQQLPHANNDASVARKYQAGFMQCANEVIRYLGQSESFTDDLKSRVVHHLASCVQLSRNIVCAKPLQSMASAGVLPAVASGQFVSSQFPNIRPSPGAATVSIAQLTSVPSAPVNIPATITSTTNTTTTTITSTTTTTPSKTQSFLKYSQPLKIEIPWVVTPIIIDPNPTQQQPKQSNTTYTTKLKVQTLPSQVSPQMTNHKQDTFMSSHTPTPLYRDISMSPIPLLPSSHSPCRDRSLSPVPLLPCNNSHKFYTLDSQYSEFIPRSRTCSLTSSSSETLSSPLNLSHSPQYYDYRELNVEYPSLVCKQSLQSSTISNSYLATKDRLLLPTSPSSSSHLTSMIVHEKKTAESDFMKYLHYMDEDRRLNPHDGSPASSVGEERLWRPW